MAMTGLVSNYMWDRLLTLPRFECPTHQVPTCPSMPENSLSVAKGQTTALPEINYQKNHVIDLTIALDSGFFLEE